MNKEERAEKWCRDIQEARQMSLTERVRICNRTAWMMVAIFVVLLMVEAMLLWMCDCDAGLNWVADMLNRAADDMHGNNQRRGVIVLGVLFMLPHIIVPLAIVLLVRRPLLCWQFRRRKNIVGN